MPSRKIDDLHPDLRPLCIVFIEKAGKLGVDALITCTYRSNAEQDELYAQGRDKPGNIVTRARGGQSAHNHTLDGKPASLAFDVVPMVNGKPMWSAAHPSWQILGEIGISLGLEWYGAPNAKFREFPHFQLKRNA